MTGTNASTAPGAVTVVIVDDEEVIRRALKGGGRQHGLVVMGEADSGEDAVEMVVDLRPDVVVMDLELAGMSGVEATERLSVLAPASRVLVLTGTEQAVGVVEAIIAGASGYILKSAGTEAIVAAIKATAAGECVISSQVAGQLLDRIRERDIPVTADSRHAAAAIRAVLTGAELEIFKRLASGETESGDRRGACPEPEHGLQPHREHPRQAPARQPDPGRRPGGTQRHLLSARHPPEPPGPSLRFTPPPG